jgi:hypothetical protein
MLHENETTAVQLSDAQRARFGELADELIPAGGGMPSATEAGATGEHLDAVLRARPDLGPPLVAMLDATEGLPAGAAVAQLKDADADGWTVLTAVVPGAYFMNPAMRDAIGYPGLEARPIDPEIEDWVEDGLLDSVKARGAVYRPTP